MADELVAPGVASPAPPPAIDTSPPPVGAQAEAPKEEHKPTIDDTLNAAWDKAQTGADRAPDGKFVAKDGKAAEAAPADKTDSAVQPPKAEAEPAKAPAIEPPQSWTAEAKAQWAKLPPETQTYIAQREGEAHKAISSYGDRLKSYQPFDDVINQFKPDFDRRGVQPAQAFAVLLNAQRRLDQNPVDGLVEIGVSYGIDLRPVLTGQQGSLPAADPRVGQVEQRLAQLQQKLEQTTQQQERQAQAEAESTLKEFAKDKPHFEDVRKLMSSFLKEGHAQSLQDAYDMAVHASPNVRARIQADQRAAEEKKRQETEARAQEEAKKKAAEAQRSGKINVRSSSAHPNPKTIDDTLREIATKAYG